MKTIPIRFILILALLAGGILVYWQQQAGADGEAESKGATKITGQCHCGKIKYKVTGEIVECNYCNCRGCQKATGTLQVPFVKVFQKDFQVISGQPKTFQSDSKAQCDVNGVWHFCSDCGSQLFWIGHHGDKMDLFAGTVDDTSIFNVKEGK